MAISETNQVQWKWGWYSRVLRTCWKWDACTEDGCHWCCTVWLPLAHILHSDP